MPLWEMHLTLTGGGNIMSEINAELIREAVFQCRCDPAWHTHYSEEAKMAIANLHREMDKLFLNEEDETYCLNIL